jgi:putative spermidine/putrescine transport system permease protein
MGGGGHAHPAVMIPRAARLLFVPAAVLYFFVLFLPQLDILATSLSGAAGGYGIDSYRKFFTDSFFLNILWRTIKLALLSTLLAVIIAYPLAVYLSQPWRRWRTLVVFAIIAPILVSAVARSYGWVIILGPNGLLTQLITALHLAADPRPVLYTEIGLVIALTHLHLPFMVLPITAALQQIDPSLMRASRILGAGGVRTFFRVTLPLSVPGITAGATIVFCLNSSSFVTPALVGGPRIPMMSFLIYQQGLDLRDWQFACAVAVVLLMSTGSVILAHLLWSSRRQRLAGAPA